MELLDGTLKLRHCTTLFTMRFPPWSLPRVGDGGGKRQFISPGLPTETGGNMVRCFFTQCSIPGASNAEEMEKIAPSLPPKEW